MCCMGFGVGGVVWVVCGAWCRWCGGWCGVVACVGGGGGGLQCSTKDAVSVTGYGRHDNPPRHHWLLVS